MSTTLIEHHAKLTNHLQAQYFLERVNNLFLGYPSCALVVSAVRGDILVVERHTLTSTSHELLYHTLLLNKDLDCTIEVITGTDN